VGKGVWLGIRDEFNESLIGTPQGVSKVRMLRRKGSNEEGSNKGEILRRKGVPWEPIPGKEGIQIKSNVHIPAPRPTSGKEIPTDDRPRQQRRFRIEKSDIEKYGTMSGCSGCENFIMERRMGNHSEECRNGVAIKVGEDGNT